MRQCVAAAGVRQMEMALSLQRLDVSRQIRHEPFGTDLIGFLPGEKQGALDLGHHPESCVAVEPSQEEYFRGYYRHRM